MAQRIVIRVAVAVLGAILVCGCGAASKPASASSARVPAGFALYRGDGFSIAVPTGFQAKPAKLSGLPTGASQTLLTAGGASPGKTDAQILALVNPNLQFSIDQVATNLREADSTDSQLSDVHTSVRGVTVAGAQEARVVTESYVTRYVTSKPAKGQINRTWLMVMPKPGTLIDVVISVEPALGGHLDPNQVIDSFRLNR